MEDLFMMPKLSEKSVALVLVAYLLVIGLGAALNLVSSFGEAGTDARVASTSAQSQLAVEGSTPCPGWLFTCGAQGEAKLLQQAFLAGIVGSFLHAAQSLTSY